MLDVLAKENPQLSLDKIAEHFNIYISIIVRANRKYNGKRGMKTNYKIPEDARKRIYKLKSPEQAVKEMVRKE